MKSLVLKSLACLSLLIPSLAAKDSGQTWPPRNFTHVVAHVYDFEQDPRGWKPVFPDGSLHRGIIRATTTRLTQPQVAELLAIITTPAEDQGETDCFDPHHAFVFYDKDWKPVGWLSICFGCDSVEASSRNAPKILDIVKLEKFVRNLALPLYDQSQDYRRLFLREQGSSKAAPGSENDAEDPFEP